MVEVPGNEFHYYFDADIIDNVIFHWQDLLPAHAKPFCIILYADKTCLLSFGTEKGYPVVSRCTNLPVDIRNSEGVGGGHLVGWLPIVSNQLLPLTAILINFLCSPRKIQGNLGKRTT